MADSLQERLAKIRNPSWSYKTDPDLPDLLEIMSDWERGVWDHGGPYFGDHKKREEFLAKIERRWRKLQAAETSERAETREVIQQPEPDSGKAKAGAKSESSEPTDKDILDSMRPAARHAYDNPETTREEKSRIWQAAKKRLLKLRSKGTQPTTPPDKNASDPPPERWLTFGRNAHGEPELQIYPPPESDEDRRLRERRELLLREERLQAERNLADRKRELDEIMRPPAPQKRPDEIIREDGYTDKEVAGYFNRRFSPQTPPQSQPRLTWAEVWSEIKQHRGWYFLAFLVGGLPVGIGTIWPILTRKTVPEWLAEHGWPPLIVLVGAWVAVALIIALVIIARSYFAVIRKRPRGD